MPTTTRNRTTNRGAKQELAATLTEAQNELLAWANKNAPQIGREALRPIIAQHFRSFDAFSNGHGRAPTRAMVKELLDRANREAKKALRVAARRPMRLGESDVTDEFEKGGPAFGAFVKSVGEAVADAQTKLDATLVKTSESLSTQNIKVVAVFEQELTDDGTMEKGTPHVMELPLINYIMPTAYQWTRVYLTADMKVSEFNGANGFNIKGKSTAFSASLSANYSLFGGFGASGRTSFSTSNYEAAGETTVARDEAAGSLHLEATLEPRPDIRRPEPFIVQKGPKLRISVGKREDVTTGNPPTATGRKVTINVELIGKQGGPLANKQIDFRVADSALNTDTTPTGNTTGQDGKIAIEIKREGASFDATKPPANTTVRIWYGLLNETVAIAV